MDDRQTLSPSAARAIAVALMREHGLREWRFGFNRAKRTMGLCRHTEQRIELSVYFVLANDAENIRDCILHEIATLSPVRGPVTARRGEESAAESARFQSGAARHACQTEDGRRPVPAAAASTRAIDGRNGI